MDHEIEDIFVTFLRCVISDERTGLMRSPFEYLAQLYPGHREAISAARLAWENARDRCARSTAHRDGDAQLLAGRYAIGALLGRGGQGDVHLARDTQLDRDVAIKLLRFAVSDTESEVREVIKRFRREADILALFNHPGICRIIDVSPEGGAQFIVMDYLRGTTLELRIQSMKKGPLPGRATIEEALTLFEGIANALHVAHLASVVHRDIKPSNIMIEDSGKAIILDFGLGHWQGDGATTLTTGAVVGTRSYLSPEQFAVPRTPLDGKTDVWSLGATLYEYLTLHGPFEADTPEQVLQAIERRDPIPPRRVNSAIPRDLSAVIMKALEKKRENRYATALDFGADLRRVREHKPIQATEPSLITRGVRWCERHRAVAGLYGVLTIALTVSIWSAVRASHARNCERARRLSAEALRVYFRDPLQGLALAIEAVAYAKREDEELAAEIASLVPQLAEQGRLRSYGDDVKIHPSNDGLYAVLDCKAGSDAVIDVSNGAIIGELPEGNVELTMFGGEKHGIIVMGTDLEGRSCMSAFAPGTMRNTPALRFVNIGRVKLSSDCDLIYDEKTEKLWSLTSPDAEVSLPPGCTDVDLSNGTWALVTVGAKKQIWDVVRGQYLADAPATATGISTSPASPFVVIHYGVEASEVFEVESQVPWKAIQRIEGPAFDRFCGGAVIVWSMKSATPGVIVARNETSRRTESLSLHNMLSTFVGSTGDGRFVLFKHSPLPGYTWLDTSTLKIIWSDGRTPNGHLVPCRDWPYLATGFAGNSERTSIFDCQARWNIPIWLQATTMRAARRPDAPILVGTTSQGEAEAVALEPKHPVRLANYGSGVSIRVSPNGRGILVYDNAHAWWVDVDWLFEHRAILHSAPPGSDAYIRKILKELLTPTRFDPARLGQHLYGDSSIARDVFNAKQ